MLCHHRFELIETCLDDNNLCLTFTKYKVRTWKTNYVCECSEHYNRIAHSQNGGGCRQLWTFCSPAPCWSRVTVIRRSRIMSRELLNVFKNGDSTMSLGNWCQCLITITVKKMLPDIQREPSCFLCPLPFALLLDTNGTDNGSAFLCSHSWDMCIYG